MMHHDSTQNGLSSNVKISWYGCEDVDASSTKTAKTFTNIIKFIIFALWN